MMAMPQFDSDGVDRATFAPVVLFDERSSKWKDVRLDFHDWKRLHELCGGDTVDDYYLNGYGVEGLVKACLVQAGLDPEAEGIDFDSEADTCFIHFSTLEEAVVTARLASEMLNDRSKISAMVRVARDNGFEDS